MVYRGSGLRFALKAGQCLRVAGNIFRKKFERHKAVQPRIFGLVDHTHPAAAEFLDDPVV
jgi:hypothetical protein